MLHIEGRQTCSRGRETRVRPWILAERTAQHAKQTQTHSHTNTEQHESKCTHVSQDSEATVALNYCVSSAVLLQLMHALPLLWRGDSRCLPRLVLVAPKSLQRNPLHAVHQLRVALRRPKTAISFCEFSSSFRLSRACRDKIIVLFALERGWKEETGDHSSRSHLPRCNSGRFRAELWHREPLWKTPLLFQCFLMFVPSPSW